MQRIRRRASLRYVQNDPSGPAAALAAPGKPTSRACTPAPRPPRRRRPPRRPRRRPPPAHGRDRTDHRRGRSPAAAEADQARYPATTSRAHQHDNRWLSVVVVNPEHAGHTGKHNDHTSEHNDEDRDCAARWLAKGVCSLRARREVSRRFRDRQVGPGRPARAQERPPGRGGPRERKPARTRARRFWRAAVRSPRTAGARTREGGPQAPPSASFPRSMWQSPPPVGGSATSIFGGAPEDVAHGVDGADVARVIRSAGSAGHRTIVRDQETTVYSTTCPTGYFAGPWAGGDWGQQAQMPGDRRGAVDAGSRTHSLRNRSRSWRGN